MFPVRGDTINASAWCPHMDCSLHPGSCDVKILMIICSERSIASDILDMLSATESPLHVAGETSLVSTAGIVAEKVKRFSKKTLDSFTHNEFDVNALFGTLQSTIVDFMKAGMVVPHPPTPPSVYVVSEPKLGRIERYDVLRHFLPCTRVILLDSSSPYLNGNIKRFFPHHFMLHGGSHGVHALQTLVDWIGFENCNVVIQKGEGSLRVHYVLRGETCRFAS